jgi:hypothetical protein
MIKGRYVFKVNGEIVFEKDNVITQNGIEVINRYLAQSVQDWAGTIVVGALGTTSASTDTSLSYEISRTPIVLRTYSPSGTYVNNAVSGSNQIILKGSLDPLLVGSIYEIGIVPKNFLQTSEKNNFYLTQFDEIYGTSGLSDWISSGASVNKTLYASSRFGNYNITLTAGSVVSRSNFNLDVNNYNTSDYLQLLYFATGSAIAASVIFSFTDTSGNSWVAPTIILNPGASGYFTASTLLSNSPASAFGYIVDTISASAASVISGVIYLDSLKLMSGDNKTIEDQLISRTSSSAALVTTKYGQPTEIEYYLTVT